MPVDLHTVEDLRAELLRFQTSTRRIFAKRATEVDPGLSAPAMAVLRRLDSRGPQPADELPARIGMDTKVVRRQVQTLESAGILQRVDDPTEPGRQLLALTDEGRRQCSNLTLAGLRQLGAALAGWSEEDLAAFTELLRRFNAANAAA